jgi:RimJ/RimL family protein N-acetyltransferase
MPTRCRRFSRGGIVRFLASNVPWPCPADGALTFIRDRVLPAMRDGTEWHWSIRSRQAPERLIGAITLMDKPENNRGFWLVPEFQGQALMSEACAAVTRYWFESPDRPVPHAPKAVANERSRRISEREGMRVVGTAERDYVSVRLREELWEITREEWRTRSGQ